MPKFKMIVTRDITESTTVEVEAPTEAEAEELAIAKAQERGVEWDIDENFARPYVTDTEELT